MTKIILLLASLLISSCAWLKEDLSEQDAAQSEDTVATEKTEDSAEVTPNENQKVEKFQEERITNKVVQKIKVSKLKEKFEKKHIFFALF